MYSKSEKDKAFLAYKELGSISKVSRTVNIPENTLANWRDKYKWAQLVKKEEKDLIEKPFDQTPYIQDICQKFELSENDGEVLNQVKCVEGICLAKLKGGDEATAKIEADALVPTNFDSAVRALKVCWETREKIFSKKETDNSGVAKINYINEVKQYFNNKEGETRSADITIPSISREGMVYKQEEDS